MMINLASRCHNRAVDGTLNRAVKSILGARGNHMNTVTANELKTKGVSAVEARLKVNEEVIISVRGQDRYVVMDVEKYAKLREYELAIALQEAKADVEAGRYTTESVADHMKRVADDV
jgi:PHD/YefM family antitoxin component YafN of YafNO toxin-antitoxin module